MLTKIKILLLLPDLKSSMDSMKGVQSHPFLPSHDSMPTIHSTGGGGGGQLPPSPNPHRSSGMSPLSIPSIPPFSGYRSYPQVGDMFTPPPKQDFYMQSPFYPGYPNYW